MKWRSIRAILVVATTCFVVTANAGGADDSNNDFMDNITGESTFRYDYWGINGDRGRFREDNWRTDQSTGGLDWLSVRTKEADEWGHKWTIEGRALYDYDYLISLLMEKEEEYYLKLFFDGRRRYYDGSNEYWNTSLYGLSRRFAELSDSDFYVDRRNYLIELGLTPTEDTEFIFGWHRQVKDGKEVLLWGGLATSGSAPNFRGIPSVQSVRSFTDTVYGEFAHTFADKYNLRIRQEWEQHRVDNQVVDVGRFQPGEDYEKYLDDPGFTNWRTMVMFDSFLDEETYVTANYMYDYLNNDSTRNFFEVPGNNPEFVNNSVGNSRRTNVGAIGIQRNNLIWPKLNFTGSVRIENFRTNANTTGFDGGAFAAMSTEHQTRVAENLRLTYEGIEKTTMTFDADLEQRDIHWDENDNSDRWRADIEFADQSYELKAVRRFNRRWKATASYRYSDLLRRYTNIIDDTAGYPGFLGTYRRKGQDLMLKTDVRINGTTSGTAMFQYVQEGITTGASGGKTQNLEIFRGSGSVSTSPIQNLFLVGSFMLENYRLNTPAEGDGGSDFAPGPRPYDFRGTSYSVLLDGSYAFNEKTSCIFGYRHTEGLGTVDYAGDYSFDKVALGVKHQLAENRHITASYQMMNFNDHSGGSFDDYTANGAMLTYSMTF